MSFLGPPPSVYRSPLFGPKFKHVFPPRSPDLSDTVGPNTLPKDAQDVLHMLRAMLNPAEAFGVDAPIDQPMQVLVPGKSPTSHRRTVMRTSFERFSLAALAGEIPFHPQPLPLPTDAKARWQARAQFRTMITSLLGRDLSADELTRYRKMDRALGGFGALPLEDFVADPRSQTGRERVRAWLDYEIVQALEAAKTPLDIKAFVAQSVGRRIVLGLPAEHGPIGNGFEIVARQFWDETVAAFGLRGDVKTRAPRTLVLTTYIPPAPKRAAQRPAHASAFNEPTELETEQIMMRDTRRPNDRTTDRLAELLRSREPGEVLEGLDTLEFPLHPRVYQGLKRKR